MSLRKQWYMGLYLNLYRIVKPHFCPPWEALAWALILCFKHWVGSRIFKDYSSISKEASRLRVEEIPILISRTFDLLLFMGPTMNIWKLFSYYLVMDMLAC